MIATLIKFINEYSLEFDWRGESLLIWISHSLIDEFLEIMEYESAEDGIEASLQTDCVVVDLVDILKTFDYDAEEEFPRKLFQN